MRRSVAILAIAAALHLLPGTASAQSIAIAHDGVGCIQAGKFPQFFARFDPRDAVSRARLHFRPGGWPHWYSVPMKAEGHDFVGVLPKPEKSLTRIEYYLSVTDKSFGESRSEEYAPVVVSGPAACEQKKLLAAALPRAGSVIVSPPQGIAGLPKVPLGFSSDSVVAGASGAGSSVAGTAGTAGPGVAGAGAAAAAGGGGLSTGALVGILGGVGAAAAGAAVVASKSGGGSPSSGGSSATSYTGPLNGQLTLSQNVSSSGPGGGTTSYTCSWVRALSGAIKVTLEQSNGTATGQAETSVTETEIGRTGPPNCSGVGPGGGNLTNPFQCAVMGTPGNLACSEQRTGTFQGLTSTYTFRFSGALSGGIISGMVTYGLAGQGSFPTFTTTFNGSTTFPVTLR